MKKQHSITLIALAMISAIFIFGAFENAKPFKSASSSNQVKQITKEQQEYWLKWKNQFVWAAPGKTSVLLPRNTGC